MEHPVPPAQPPQSQGLLLRASSPSGWMQDAGMQTGSTETTSQAGPGGPCRAGHRMRGRVGQMLSRSVLLLLRGNGLADATWP